MLCNSSSRWKLFSETENRYHGIWAYSWLVLYPWSKPDWLMWTKKIAPSSWVDCKGSMKSCDYYYFSSWKVLCKKSLASHRDAQDIGVSKKSDTHSWMHQGRMIDDFGAPVHLVKFSMTLNMWVPSCPLQVPLLHSKDCNLTWLHLVHVQSDRVEELRKIHRVGEESEKERWENTLLICNFRAGAQTGCKSRLLLEDGAMLCCVHSCFASEQSAVTKPMLIFLCNAKDEWMHTGAAEAPAGMPCASCQQGPTSISLGQSWGICK